MAIVIPHAVCDDHLEEVIEYMEILGSPRIRCIDIAGVLYALEGSHRVVAASRLGYTVECEVLDRDSAIDDLEGLDLDVCGRETVAELEDLLGVYPGPIVNVDTSIV